MRSRRAQSILWNSVGVVLFVILVFPVFWMISTAFKPDEQINSLTPTWFSAHPTVQHFRDAINKPFFWVDLKNTLIIVGATVVIGIALAFLAAVALAKYRFTGRKLFIVLVIGIQMLPGVGLVIPLYVVLARYHQVDTLTGVIVTYLTAALPFSVWTLRGFLIGIPKDLEEAAMVDGSTRLERSSGSCCRWSHRVSWRRASSPSSRAGTSTLRAPAAERPGEADDHGLALVLPRHEPRHRLGRADGGVDAHGDPGGDLLPDRAAEDRVRADGRRGQGLTGGRHARPARGRVPAAELPGA